MPCDDGQHGLNTHAANIKPTASCRFLISGHPKKPSRAAYRPQYAHHVCCLRSLIAMQRSWQTACSILFVIVTTQQRVYAFAPDANVIRTPPSSAPSQRTSAIAMMTTMPDLSIFVAENQLAADVVTSGLLAGVGDTIAQKQQQRELGIMPATVLSGLDRERLQRFVLKGCGSGVLWSNWFAISDQWCSLLTAKLQLYAPTLMSGALCYTLASILLEQFIWCPIVYSFWDLSFPALLRGDTFSEIRRNVQQKLGGLLLANAKVWTLVNLVVYSIPLEWRVILTTIVDLFWQSFVSKTTASSSLGQTLDRPSPTGATQLQSAEKANQG